MNVLPPDFILLTITHSASSKATLPNGKVRPNSMRKATLNQPDGPFNRDLLRRDEQVDVVRHHNEGVELVTSLTPVVLQGFQEELAFGVRLKEAAAVPGGAGHEVHSGRAGPSGNRHGRNSKAYLRG